MIATFEIPVRTHNPLNGSQFGGINWAKAARRKKERKATRLCCLAFIDALEGIGSVASVTFTRIAPRALDDDGLAASCKSIRDGERSAIMMHVVEAYLRSAGLSLTGEVVR